MRLIIVIFFISFISYGQTVRYASPSGSGTEDGTSAANSWASVDVNDNLVPNMTVNFVKGTYPGNLRITKSGTATQPIIIRGYGTTPGDIAASNGSTFDYGDTVSASVMPLITQTRTNSEGAGTGILVTGNYVSVENFQVQYFSKAVEYSGNFGGLNNIITVETGDFNPAHTWPTGTSNPGLNYNGTGIQIFGNNNAFNNLYVENAGAQGIQIRGDNNRLDYNEVHSDQSVNSTDYYFFFSSGSTPGSGANDNLATNITSYRHGSIQHFGHGIVFKGSNDIQNNVVDGFTIYNTYLELQFPFVFNNTIRNGTIIKESGIDPGVPQATGLRTANGAHDNTFDNIVLQNCTLKFQGWNDGLAGGSPQSGVDNVFNQIIQYGGQSSISFQFFQNNFDYAATGNTFYNCTFYDDDYLYQLSRANSGTTFINCVWEDIRNLSFFSGGSSGYSFSGTHNNSHFHDLGFSTPSGTSISTGDPLFVDAPNADFTPDTGSPLLGQGIATPFLSAGNDIGAVQTAGGPPADVTAPTVSNVVVTVLSDTEVNVTWDLDEAGTRYTVYGLTAAYGTTTPETVPPNPYFTSHSWTWTGLTAGTLYHYSLRGEDAAGNTYSTSDATFTTNEGPETPPPGIVDVRGVKSRFLKRKRL